MMRQLARDHSRLWDTIAEVAADSSDGSPRAQRKMQERIKRAGALTTELWPGKRGRYTWRAPIELMGNATVVLKRHHKREALVAATVF
jgi:hypothetical protein